MGKNKVYTIALAAFLVCGAVSFGITKYVKGHTSADDISETAMASAPSGSAGKSVPDEGPKPGGQPDANGSNSGEQPGASMLDEAKKLEEQKKLEALRKAKEAKPAETEAKPAAAPKTQSYDELTAIVNGRSSDYPRNISIKYTNLDTENGEEAQTSVANIRGYIRAGIWKSVTVVGATYDSRGKVTSLTLRINR